MNVLRLQGVETNSDTGQKEAVAIIPNNALVFLRDVVDAFDQKMLQGFIGDPDDPAMVELAGWLKSDIHEIWTALNPS
jgi:hypothetical protein